jgi:aspartyl-tRNA(Asn)/glutamyl-tRNA(Gln) amidotransferase subunit A
MKPYELTIAEAMDEMAAGELSAVELTESCLRRIEEIDDRLRAFITVDRDGALSQAAAADRERSGGRGGALCGVPLSIKDLLSTKGVKTTCGSKILENYIPPYDATVVENIRREGGVILGKVAMDEFAMGSTSQSCAFGVVHNPSRKG